MALLLAGSFSSLLFSRYKINVFNYYSIIKIICVHFWRDNYKGVDEVQSTSGVCTMNSVYTFTIYDLCTLYLHVLNIHCIHIVHCTMCMFNIYNVCLIHVKCLYFVWKIYILYEMKMFIL